MKINILKGTNQIGGCITEISTDTTRIIIDFGEELDNDLPKVDVAGLTQESKKYDAVLFTHYHGDHIGRFNNVLKDIPLYMGEVAKQIFEAFSERVASNKEEGYLEVVKSIKTFKPYQSFMIGDIKITAYPVDHSAYDSCMFLIEADGKRVLHTGDFRDHGIRGKGLDFIIKNIKNVDVVITEGTQLSRNMNSNVKTEFDLEKEFVDVYNKYHNVIVLCSSTNIDRIAIATKAARRVDKYLLCNDESQLAMFDIITKQAVTDIYDLSRIKRFYLNGLNRYNDKGFIFFAKAGTFNLREIKSRLDLANTVLVYSMWSGYLDKETMKYPSIVEAAEGIEVIKIHTSGHATPNAIKRLVDGVHAKKVIHIHGFNKDKIHELELNAEVIDLDDCTEYEVE